MKTQALTGILVLAAAAELVFASTPSTNLRTNVVDGHELEEPMLIPDIKPIGLIEDRATVFDAPEGGTSPFANLKEPVVFWPEESKLPKVVQWFFAGLWVFMLASMPFLIPVMSGKAASKTQKSVGAAMLVVLFGGFYLFTNIILFQSIHFKRIRTLTMVECIYFMTQVITTVGYGDVGPAKVRGQVFVALYVLGALFVIAMLISDLTTHMVAKAKDYKAKRAEAAHAVGGTVKVKKTLRALIHHEKPSFQAFLLAVAVFAVVDIVWISFFSLHPREGKTLFQALYMSVITLSTVGFGYFTPVTEEGMIFGAFMMLFGSAALVSVISNFTKLMVDLDSYERSSPEETCSGAMEVLKTVTNGSQEVTEAQFLRFTLLQTKRCDEKQIERILEAFGQLKPTKEGKVALKSVEDALEVGEAASQEDAK